MASITWNSRLETGFEPLDGQHRTLIDTYNRISAMLGRPNPNRNELDGALAFLRDFALAHFETEHELMARHGYPGEERHRQCHAELVQEMEMVLDGLHRGTWDLDPVTLEYLDAWLVRHIQEEDFRLADFLRLAVATQKGTP